ncbi:hypothetical protein HYY75_02590 [bacterium]|nr:hypothetical protein [bacterium]
MKAFFKIIFFLIFVVSFAQSVLGVTTSEKPPVAVGKPELPSKTKENLVVEKKKSSPNKPFKKSGEWLVSVTDIFRYENWNTFLANNSLLDNDYSL